MLRIAALALAALVATGCMGGAVSGRAKAVPAASLEISITPGGEAPTKIWTLRCGPDRGTLPNPADACRRLLRLRDPFAPVRKGVACTAIYGGPQEAEVHGTFRGRRVDAQFNRGDGCQIARWDRVRFLFPEA